MKAYLKILGIILAVGSVSLYGVSAQKNTNDTPAPAQHFEGFDLSAGVGYSGITLLTSRSGIKPVSNTNYGADGVGIQLKASGSYAFFDRGLIGIELYGQYNSAQTKNKFFETSTSPSATNRVFELPWNIGLDLKLGLVAGSSSLLFIYGGVDWGEYKFQYTTSLVNNRYEKFKLGGVFGGGIQQLFSNNWYVKTTIDYRWYPSETLSYSNGEQQTIKARLATSLFMFGYLF